MSQNHCFTYKAQVRLPYLSTQIGISLPSQNKTNQPKYPISCIWDTGASMTVITQKVVDALGLKPTGRTITNTASETGKVTDTFEIDLFLSNDCFFSNITVNLGKVSDSINCLLGLDIIGQGDFSLTCLNGGTCLSFRYPSCHEIDFIGDYHKGKQLQHYNTFLAKQAVKNKKNNRR